MNFSSVLCAQLIQLYVILFSYFIFPMNQP